MTNAIAKIENYDALDSAIGSAEGEPLRFKDGGFIRGFDKVDVPVKTRMSLHPASVSDGFIKWEDGKPVEWKLREWANPSQFPILRDALDDNDESQWPDGKDPWSFTMMIAMKDAEGVMLTFSTGSVGGTKAVRKVLRDWRLARNKHPGAVPVVELGVDSYEHKIHRTTVKFPVFTIVDWASWDGDELPPQVALTASQEIKEELNDDIPNWAQ